MRRTMNHETILLSRLDLLSKEDREAFRWREHYEKYEKLSMKIGVGYLMGLVLEVADRETLAERFEKDPNLNNIEMLRWDRAGVVVSKRPDKLETCPCCKQKIPFVPTDLNSNQVLLAPFSSRAKQPLSLADKVCILKHVARYHVLGAPEPRRVKVF